ncbi:MAG: VanW family protein [Polyangiaceae bacterium]
MFRRPLTGFIAPIGRWGRLGRLALAFLTALALSSVLATSAAAPTKDASSAKAKKKTGKSAKAKSDTKSDGKDDAKSADGKAKSKKQNLDKLEVLARATTRFPCCEERVKNIKRIAKLVDGVVVQPGESLSLNQLVGPRTEEKGYVKAPSIMDLDYVETVGGGVSQFATTLYNALYDAGFPILDHKPHSHYIGRYPDGVEATLSWPAPDLVFKNDSDSPLVIKTTVKRDRVSVKLLGHTPGRKVTRKRPVILERRAPPVELIPDATISPKRQKVERPGSPRKAVQVTRIVENPGKPRKVEEEVVIYLASKRVIRVHPCKLPKGHDKYTGEACPNGKKTKAATEKKSKGNKAPSK